MCRHMHSNFVSFVKIRFCGFKLPFFSHIFQIEQIPTPAIIQELKGYYYV